MNRVDDGMSRGALQQILQQGVEETKDSAQVTLQNYIELLTTSYQKKAQGDASLGPAGMGPQLEAPGVTVDAAAVSVLLLKLQKEAGDAQLKTAMEAIKNNKEELKAKHEERLKKLMHAFEKMEKSKKSGLFGKIFGWIGVVVAVVAAIAASVATGGVAVGPCVAAVMAVTMMVLSQTGAMDKIMEGMTNLMKSMGMGEPAAQIMASVVITAVVLAVSLGGPAAVSSAASSMGATVANQTIQISRMASMAEKFGEMAQATRYAAQAANIAVQVGTTASGTASGIYQSQALSNQADAAEIEKFIAKIQQKMEDEQDRIQEIIQQLQSSTSTVMNMLKTEHETKVQITRMSV